LAAYAPSWGALYLKPTDYSAIIINKSSSKCWWSKCVTIYSKHHHENLLEQVNLAEQLTSSDFGVSTGLFNQGYWESSKWYFVNVERGNIADKFQPRNINVSFNNASNVAIDILIFTFYSDQ
jgi:hypothetical protein